MSNRLWNCLKGLGVIAVLFSVSTASQAALVTLYGDDVSYTFDDASPYGSGYVVGNSIFFNPTTVLAQASNAAGVDFANATLNIGVKVHSGSDYVLSGFQFLEAGDYLLFGGSTSASAESRVSVASLTSMCGLLPCVDAQIFGAGDLDNTGSLSPWELGGSIDLGGVSGWGADTDVLLQIQNVLTAVSLEQGELAFVQKKFLGVGAQVIPEVPLPAAAWLFGSALIGLAGLRRFRALRAAATCSS